VEPKVPRRTVAPSRALQRSQSIDYVRINKRNAALTPRRQPAPAPPNDWKMARFNRVGPRVFAPPKPMAKDR